MSRSVFALEILDACGKTDCEGTTLFRCRRKGNARIAGGEERGREAIVVFSPPNSICEKTRSLQVAALVVLSLSLARARRQRPRREFRQCIGTRLLPPRATRKSHGSYAKQPPGISRRQWRAEVRNFARASQDLLKSTGGRHSGASERERVSHHYSVSIYLRRQQSLVYFTE